MKFDSDFLKDRYDYELKRKEQITAALTLPVGILIAVGAAWVAMFQSFSYTDGYLMWFFLLFLGLAAVAFVVCVVYLGRAYHRQTHWQLPQLSELKKFRKTSRGMFKQIYLREFYGEKEYPGKEQSLIQAADDLFQNDLEMKIIEAADKNTKNNNIRSDRYLYRARRWIFRVLILIAITGVIYGVNQVRYEMTSKDTKPTQPPVTPAQVKIIKPQLPEFPKNLQIREGD